MLRHGALQVAYAMEAVKQGSAAIGLRSRNHVVLACVNKVQSELSSHQRKIFKVNDHIGVIITGFTADGRVLSRYMRSESINHSFTYESPLPVGRRVVHLADQAHLHNLEYKDLPFMSMSYKTFILANRIREECLASSITYVVSPVTTLPTRCYATLAKAKNIQDSIVKKNCTENNDSNKKVNFSEEEEDPEEEKKVVSSKKRYGVV
ncbi:unnamed protein product [Arabis nemorensis]|uniref:Proteasome alpha-type subunits domain-containing protein n=1 Tax=Arabis nemorensis TaxID=586526 RepID=A0A565BIJ1_9BRAS|nr:unnamed protein product [Arabis nemorensis]